MRCSFNVLKLHAVEMRRLCVCPDTTSVEEAFIIIYYYLDKGITVQQTKPH